MYKDQEKLVDMLERISRYLQSRGIVPHRSKSFVDEIEAAIKKLTIYPLYRIDQEKGTVEVLVDSEFKLIEGPVLTPVGDEG